LVEFLGKRLVAAAFDFAATTVPTSLIWLSLYTRENKYR
jgi:hypothetical protein